MTNWLYKLTHTIVLWIGPVLLVLTSCILILPNNALFKSVIASDGFYEQLSTEIQSTDNSEKTNLQTIVIRSVFKDVATKDWLQNVTETNIDAFILWLTGEKNSWEIYLPAEDIQKSLYKNIDSEITKTLSQQSDSIPTCGLEDSKEIQERGFSFNNAFCLPAVVKSGEQSLTEFMGLGDESLQSSFLDSFFSDNQIGTNGQITDAEKILSTNTENQSRLNTLEYIRNGFVQAKSVLPTVWLIFLGLVCGSIVFAKSAGKTFLGEIRRLCFLLGVNTLVLCLSLILFFGGLNYLTSSVTELILPGILSSSISSLVFWKILIVVATLFSVSIFAGLFLIVIRIALGLVQSLNLFSSVTSKNEKLKNTKWDLDRNPTHDGEFQRRLEYIPPQTETQPVFDSSKAVDDNIQTKPYQSKMDYSSYLSKHTSIIYPPLGLDGEVIEAPAIVDNSAYPIPPKTPTTEVTRTLNPSVSEENSQYAEFQPDPPTDSTSISPTIVDANPPSSRKVRGL